MGVPLTLVGYNFGAQETVTSYWDSIGRSPLTTATTDATGAFTAKTRVPQMPYGAHIISVGQSSGISFTTPFHVWPILALMPTGGPSGTPVIATGQGFGAAESVTLYWEKVGGLVLGRTTTSARGGFTGSSAIHFTVPSAPPGSYLVCAYGHTTGAYRCRTFNATG